MSSLTGFYRVPFSSEDSTRIEAYLFDHPPELRDFESAVTNTCLGMLAWGDYKTPPELFSLMCLISYKVRYKRGEDVLGFHDDPPKGN